MINHGDKLIAYRARHVCGYSHSNKRQ